MDLKTFAENVEMMREAQKAYFQARKSSDLNNSKMLEKMIDEQVNDILHPEIKNQLDLF